ncbi:hypothetical protein [Phaeovulum sp.]|uniref:hypothetical protein n=1 Tax=Phaeovulum sp. TaxID=2934796 RepID=UPI00272F902D|nr:hypothetical protein [Phaeovulum sp.]MDP1668281.1 hypothetical protein [Phaeovulum sp.]MDZ4118129.1 hypothetical protein [Phaeovulum sp.]
MILTFDALALSLIVIATCSEALRLARLRQLRGTVAAASPPETAEHDVVATAKT